MKPAADNHVLLTVDMVKQALRMSDALTGCQVRFALGTGARLREVERLDWGDLDLEVGRVWFSHPKTMDGGRGVPLPPHVLEMMRELKDATEGEVIGPVWGKGGQSSLIARWRDLFAKWAKAYERGTVTAPPPPGCPPLHSLRHLVVQLLLDRGVPDEQINHWAGSSHIAAHIRQRYANTCMGGPSMEVR